jgi:CRISPR/Cas system-associated exonuclease Cas4 (RecB family)
MGQTSALKHESLKREIKKQPHLIGLCDVLFAAEELMIYGEKSLSKAPDLIFHGRLDNSSREGLYWILVEVKSIRTRENAEHAKYQLASGKRYLQDHLNIENDRIVTLLAYREKDGEIKYQELNIR